MMVDYCIRSAHRVTQTGTATAPTMRTWQKSARAGRGGWGWGGTRPPACGAVVIPTKTSNNNPHTRKCTHSRPRSNLACASPGFLLRCRRSVRARSSSASSSVPVAACDGGGARRNSKSWSTALRLTATAAVFPMTTTRRRPTQRLAHATLRVQLHPPRRGDGGWSPMRRRVSSCW
jgi:hypothetical protein